MQAASDDKYLLRGFRSMEDLNKHENVNITKRNVKFIHDQVEESFKIKYSILILISD